MKKIIIAIILIIIVCFATWVLLTEPDTKQQELQEISQTLQTYSEILENNPTAQQLIEIKTGLNQIETKLTELENRGR